MGGTFRELYPSTDLGNLFPAGPMVLGGHHRASPFCEVSDWQHASESSASRHLLAGKVDLRVSACPSNGICREEELM